jgi:PIN domain nuclease of toxin-antitoxin system
MIVLDTHVWVWWIGNPEKLSKRARDIVQQARKDDVIYLSSISVWEVTLLVAKGRLHLTMDVGDWIARSEALPFFHFLPVDNHIAQRAVLLPEPLHNDPADRMIIATAMSLGADLVTKDRKIRNQQLWVKQVEQ